MDAVLQSDSNISKLHCMSRVSLSAILNALHDTVVSAERSYET